MKLEKAIEILELNLKEAGALMPADCKEAVQLGVEDMKQTLQDRQGNPLLDGDLLPGETEE